MMPDYLNTPRTTTPALPPWLVKDAGLDGLDYWSVRLHFDGDNSPCSRGPRYFGAWANRAAAEIFYVRALDYLRLAPEVTAGEQICDLLNLMEDIGDVIGDESDTSVEADS